MSQDFLAYSRSNAVHQAVDYLIKNPEKSIVIKVDQKEKKIIYQISSADEKINEIVKNEKGDKVSFFKAVGNSIALAFRCCNPRYYKKYKNAFKRLYEAAGIKPQTVQAVKHVAQPILPANDTKFLDKVLDEAIDLRMEIELDGTISGKEDKIKALLANLEQAKTTNPEKHDAIEAMIQEFKQD
ncbi:MAG: hypothetical protein LLF94_12345 [Chlamydiales bacterium]|nr:hypothetical protein [Chlamydiales bacterium]